MGHRSNQLYAAKIAALPRPVATWPRWVVTGGGLGYLRPAPGSWGTAGPAAVYWLALYCQVAEPYRSLLFLLGGLMASVVLVRLGPWACAYFRQPDPGQVVIDEFAGFWVAVAFVPVPARFTAAAGAAWLFTAGVYVLFRLTDTLKLPPARQLEQLPYGWGILLDDIAAGIQANVIAQLIVRLAM